MADIDDLRRELERVRLQNKRLKDSSSLALVELTVDGRVVGWNRQAEVVFGWREDEIVGQHFAIFVPPAARHHVDAVFGALVRGEIQHSRNLNVHKDGRQIVCQWYNAVVRDDHGEVYLVYCEVRDVTTEEELRQRQQLLQVLADRSPLGIWMMGPDLRYIYANDEFARSVRRTPAEVIGEDDRALFPPALAEELRRHHAEVLAADGPRTREDVGVGPNGDSTYSSLEFPVRGASGELLALCGIVHDITSLREGERERAALQQQVIESQRQTLAELSTPLIPVADGVLVMPLVGAVDPARAEMIMAALLTGVAAQRAHAVILDITGVHTMDTSVADALLRSARAVKLLGAEPILTGVGPSIAQTLVTLGVDLGGIVTLGSLRDGVSHVLQASRRAAHERTS